MSTLFFGIGMLGTAYALEQSSLTLLYIFYGVIGGVGLGVGYITPVSTLVKYFPHNRGFATGLAIMGFGFAALIAGPLMQYLTAAYSLVQTFQILGVAYIIIMTLSSLYLKPPTTATTTTVADSKDGAKTETPKKSIFNRGMNAHEAMKTWQFSALWWIFFINITCGIGLLAVASPMAQEIVGMNATEAASMVGIIGLLNGLGRIGWSTISDYIVDHLPTCCSSSSKSWPSLPSAIRATPSSSSSSCSLLLLATAAVLLACRLILVTYSAPKRSAPFTAVY